MNKSSSLSKPHPFNIIIKPTGASCMLACDYCYFLKKKKLYPQSDFRMGDIVLEKFIQEYIGAHPPGEIQFTWQGGEPTQMGLSFFKRVISYQRKYCIPKKTIKNALQTNGYLLNDEWGAFLKENNFLVGLSIDGPPGLHNQYRKTKQGQGTFTKALEGLKILQAHNVDVNLLACVSAANVHTPLDVYRFFRDVLLVKYLQFIPIVERVNKTGNQRGEKLSQRSITGDEYGNFLIAIYEEWIHKDVGKIFIQLFETCLGIWVGLQSSICVFAEICGSCLALEHNGDLYACDHYVQPDACIGNIMGLSIHKMVRSDYQVAFGENKYTSLPQQCLRCDVRFICNGGCPKNRITIQKNEKYPINHLCAGYTKFFHHIKESMHLMASLVRMKQPVSGVMNIYQK